jgi:hypothetical protein
MNRNWFVAVTGRKIFRRRKKMTKVVVVSEGRQDRFAAVDPCSDEFDYWRSVIGDRPDVIAMEAGILCYQDSRTDWHLRRMIAQGVREGIQFVLYCGCVELEEFEKDPSGWSEAFKVFTRAKRTIPKEDTKKREKRAIFAEGRISHLCGFEDPYWLAQCKTEGT